MDDEDIKIQDPVVRSLAEYIKTSQFQRQFEQFFLDHALTFTDELEHQLAYMTIYIEFQHMFNENMKIFLEQQKLTEDEFADHCQKVMKVDPKAEQYLEIVIASMDYEAFFGLMKTMRGRAAVESRRADAKDCDDTRACGKRKSADGKLSKDEEGPEDVEDEGAAKGAKGANNDEKEESKDSK